MEGVLEVPVVIYIQKVLSFKILFTLGGFYTRESLLNQPLSGRSNLVRRYL
jgi:hypothetical protein